MGFEAYSVAVKLQLIDGVSLGIGALVIARAVNILRA